MASGPSSARPGSASSSRPGSGRGPPPIAPLAAAPSAASPLKKKRLTARDLDPDAHKFMGIRFVFDSDLSVAEQLHEALEKKKLRVADIFREVDKDGSGAIDKEEFRDAFKIMGPDFPRDVVDATFAAFWPPACRAKYSEDESPVTRGAATPRSSAWRFHRVMRWKILLRKIVYSSSSILFVQRSATETRPSASVSLGSLTGASFPPSRSRRFCDPSPLLYMMLPPRCAMRQSL